MKTTDDMVQELIRLANMYGLEGKRIIRWIPPQDAGDDSRGKFIFLYGSVEVGNSG